MGEPQRRRVEVSSDLAAVANFWATVFLRVAASVLVLLPIPLAGLGGDRGCSAAVWWGLGNASMLDGVSSRNYLFSFCGAVGKGRGHQYAGIVG